MSYVSLIRRWVGPRKGPLRGSVRRTSQIAVVGVPLWQIARGPSPLRGEICGHARGIFAIGDVADGIIAVGGVARGIVAAGGIAVGVIALGGVSVSLLAGLGGVAVSMWRARGGVAIAQRARGGLVIDGIPLRSKSQ